MPIAYNTRALTRIWVLKSTLIKSMTYMLFLQKVGKPA
ncbi:hypothetical protein HMPREF9952_2099 [Haemophilus pittmaniae HK 85]|uniref:Uncharacterized protein n=1 Tax=Haemophilus pittmaniae HK 85 TaxID=1035188 RepID=F9Q646_9PAST|nr:hypothetical protein HMPREF9952_2099 [Haemophilus pittmaniae HK 85]